jgi:hypothetical protein
VPDKFPAVFQSQTGYSKPYANGCKNDKCLILAGKIKALY